MACVAEIAVERGIGIGLLISASVGALRIGELLPEAAGNFNERRHLTLRRVCVTSAAVTVRLDITKTDPRAEHPPVQLLSAIHGHPLDPVAAVRAALRVSGDGAAALCIRPGVPLTVRHVTAAIKLAATDAGLDPTWYSSHSLRIGALNTLLAAGFPRDWCQEYCRWASPQALAAYIRQEFAPRQAPAPLFPPDQHNVPRTMVLAPLPAASVMGPLPNDE